MTALFYLRLDLRLGSLMTMLLALATRVRPSSGQEALRRRANSRTAAPIPSFNA